MRKYVSKCFKMCLNVCVCKILSVHLHQDTFLFMYWLFSLIHPLKKRAIVDYFPLLTFHHVYHVFCMIDVYQIYVLVVGEGAGDCPLSCFFVELGRAIRNLRPPCD